MISDASVALASVLPPAGKPYAIHFVHAGQQYGIPPCVLAAICEHESRFGEALTPPGPAGTGDGGHGHGLMQIDDRYHDEWIVRREQDGTPLWTLPQWNIQEGAAILEVCMKAFALRLKPAISAYNAGIHAVARALRSGQDADSVTANGRYARQILESAAVWHKAVIGTERCGCSLCSYARLQWDV